MTTHTLPPEVKVLSWERVNSTNEQWAAASIVGDYRAVERGTTFTLTRRSGDYSMGLGRHATIDEAKAAAQANYTSLILSALEPSGEGVGATAVAWRIRERPGDPWHFTDYDPERMPNVRGFERQPLYAQPLSGMEGAEQRTMETACRILMTKIYNRGHSGLDLDCLLCQAYIAADRLLAFETGSAPSEEVRSWDRRLSTPVSAASPEGEAGKWDDARINDWMGRHEVRLPNPAYDELRSMLSHAPEGFVLVPAEPIGAMIEAGWSVLNSAKWPTPKSIFAAMLAAAPATQEKNRG